MSVETVVMQWWAPRVGGLLALLALIFFGVWASKFASALVKILEMTAVAVAVCAFLPRFTKIPFLFAAGTFSLCAYFIGFGELFAPRNPAGGQTWICGIILAAIPETGFNAAPSEKNLTRNTSVGSQKLVSVALFLLGFVYHRFSKNEKYSGSE